jgi:RNA polymerase sigma-70 factor (ECF subfamily)
MIDGMTDIELLNRVRARDKSALAALYDRYQTPTFSLACYVLDNPQTAEEVLQDVFLYVWDRPDAWDASRGGFLTWLLTVTRYRAIDRLRGREHRRRTHEVALDDDAEASWWLATGEDAESEDGRLLRTLIERLPHEQAELIEMAFYKGMTHSTIASATGIPLGTIKGRLRHGLQTLKTLWLREMEIMDK